MLIDTDIIIINQYEILLLLNVLSSAVRMCLFVLWGGWRVDGGKVGFNGFNVQILFWYHAL